MNAAADLRGYALLHNARCNKGSAFTQAERDGLGLNGLLPDAVQGLQLQIARVIGQLEVIADDLQKYLFLFDLQGRNQTLYYAVLMSDPARFMPLVYTPTVGEACQKFDHFFRGTRGLYLPISAKGRVREWMKNWPQQDVRFIVVTDGERILGLGDLGVGGMGIPIGKLALYTACAGVPPDLSLPVMLDVGTNNPGLQEDPLYLGLRHERVRGAEYHAFVDEFVAVVQELYPKCCIQWEDFANFNAYAILERWRDKICTYNDDIQGTAAVALAGLYAAIRISGQKLSEQRVLFLGGGAAATGIAELISEAMVLEGLTIEQARGRNWLYDIHGLVTRERTDLTDFQTPFAHEHPAVASFVAAIESIKPTAIVGVSTVPKLFNQAVIEAMSRVNPRPIIFPYSNPTSRSECTAQEAYTWSKGQAIFASGSPFDPVTLGGKTLIPGQGNNVYVFPAVGLAVLATGATRVTQEMFICTAQAVAEQVTQDELDSGLIYPPQSHIFEASLHAAERVAELIFERGLARVPRPADVRAHVRSFAYSPVYTNCA